MDVLLVDDGLAFDGLTPPAQPLGGAEKAFASLPAALRRRGHDVRVINRCANALTADGVPWRRWEDARPRTCDVLIAHRRTALLDFPVEAGRRILWLNAHGRTLADPIAHERLVRHADVPIVVSGPHHRSTCPRELAARVVEIAPGVRDEYRQAPPCTPAQPPRAIVTTHPAMDLGWLVDLWRRAIRPRVPTAELFVYSALLARAAAGAEVPSRIATVAAAVAEAAADGVVVRRPMGDADMAEAYRSARVHLYPGAAGETLCSTLAEAQAVGVPAVTRRFAAAGERIRDGETGFAVPDDEAFANCAFLLLAEDSVWRARSEAARTHMRGRSWDDAAADFERLFA